MEQTEDKIETSTTNNHLTLSTKLSTDQLICKTPQESASSASISVKSCKRQENPIEFVFYLGTCQLILGVIMTVLGSLVIRHEASLAHLGGGIWGGCLVISTGLCGIITSSKTLCPLKPTAQKVCHTVFLALSLVSLAISQLVVVLASTGLARDLHKFEILNNEEPLISMSFPSNYPCLLLNITLLITSTTECICAALAAYKSSRQLCPCFQRQDEEKSYKNINFHNSHALVSSWLGKQPQNSHIYIVGPPSNLTQSSAKITPIYALPPSVIQPQIFGYPLIPAPLGPIPSPIIPPPSRREMLQKIRKYRAESRSRQGTPSREPASRPKSRQKSEITDAEVARTYTGLDRTIAEEFIDICESKHPSLISSCSSESYQNATSEDLGDAASQEEYLLRNKPTAL